MKNIRYYGEDYKQHTINVLDSVRDAVAGSDYAQIIRNTNVSTNNGTLKIECVQAGSNAYAQVDLVREKLNKLVTILRPFYDGVDETSDSVLGSAKKMRELLEETNNALVRMNDAVNGIGDYSGTKVTPEALKDAGLDEEKCAGLKADIWDKLFSIQFRNGEISYDEAVAFVDYIDNLQKNGIAIPDSAMKNADAAVGVYIDKIKSLDPDKIPMKDMARIAAIYDYYCTYHLGPNKNITELSDQALNNGIDVYEIINPDAKNRTDAFFIDAYAVSDDTINQNIKRIKYALYTSDPEERDLMLRRLPDIELNIIAPGKNASCTYSDPPVLNIDLRNGNASRCCSFFHEFGHALDCIDGFPSDKYMDDLVQDFKNHMHNALAEMGINLPADQAQEVIDYFFTAEGSNVINSEGIDSPYPSNWTTTQAMAYYQLRDYYGYVEYEYNPWKYATENNKAFKTFTHNGYTSGVLYGSNNSTNTYGNTTANYYANQGANNNSESTKPWRNDYGIVSDVGGGLTNNQIGNTCSGHGADITNNAGIIRDSSELRRRLKYYNYFYDDQNPDNGTDLDRTEKQVLRMNFLPKTGNMTYWVLIRGLQC